MSVHVSADEYIDDVEGIVRSFRYAFCDVCSRDLDRHVIVPFMGHPFVKCLDSAW